MPQLIPWLNTKLGTPDTRHEQQGISWQSQCYDVRLTNQYLPSSHYLLTMDGMCMLDGWIDLEEWLPSITTCITFACIICQQKIRSEINHKTITYGYGRALLISAAIFL